jgi:D-inositol-3-phosphate glycosyltransferase
VSRRIALISEHASPLATIGGADSGGQNVYVAEVARHLAARGHSVDVFTRRDRDDLPAVFCWEPGVRVVHVPAGPAEPIRKEALHGYMPAFAAWMEGFIRRQPKPYDLAHANFYMSGMVALELKRRLGLPFVITFHALGRVRRLYQGGADAFPDARFAAEERIMAEADRVVAECPQDRDDMVALYGADPARIAVVPCGVDPEEFFPINRELARLSLGLPLDEPLLLQLGRMVPRKGVDNVIRAAGRLRHRYGLAARLVIVGGESDDPDPAATPEIARLQRIAVEEGVANRVLFTGRRPHAAAKYFFSAADLFVTTPWYEPFGITPLEAMACGTPVIGSAVGGIKYTVRDGETGVLVPPNDPEALAAQVARLLRSPPLLARLRRQAIDHVRTNFTWAGVADSLAALYEEVVTCSASATVPTRSTTARW